MITVPVMIMVPLAIMVAVPIMVVVIPIAIRMPATPVFVPPSMIGVPAALSLFVQLMAPVFGLLTLVAVMLDGFVQLVISFREASLAIVVIGAQPRRAGKHEKASQRNRSNHRLSEKRIVRTISHRCCALPTFIHLNHVSGQFLYRGRVRDIFAAGLRYSPCVIPSDNAPRERSRPGLCANCLYARRVESGRGSTFYLCERSLTDPAFPKYPRLPVLQCSGHTPKA